MHIAELLTDAQIDACWPVMRQLRPQFDLPAFRERARRQRSSGYRLAAAHDDSGVIRAVAGFRFGENMAWGRHLYVDDLVSDEAARGQGFAKALFHWLLALAREHGCEQFHLDSGVQRFGAHRFYLSQGMRISSHHFVMNLGT